MDTNARRPSWSSVKALPTSPVTAAAALLAKEGITANAIAPALVETEMITSNPKARPDLILVGRFGTVEEVADVVVMLASNGYITGQTISVNGAHVVAVAVRLTLLSVSVSTVQPFPQHFLYFLPLPQGHGSLRPIIRPSRSVTVSPTKSKAVSPGALKILMNSG